jgi:hypothetical protein
MITKNTDSDSNNNSVCSRKKYITGSVCLLGTLLLSWLVLFPYRGLKFLGSYGNYLGKNPAIHVLIVIAVFYYLYLILISPGRAAKSADVSWRTIKGSFLNIIGALLIAGAALELIPTTYLTALLGEQAGIKAVFAGVSIGTVMPACPFITYPVIAVLYGAGAGFAGTMAMLFGAGLAFACTISADIIHFDKKIMSLRLVLSFLAALVAALLFYFSGINL